MQTLIQKIHVEQEYSFACRRYRTPHFETGWHKHEECELIYITEGNGTALIGDYVGEYKTGDIFFIASDVPHTFRKRHHKMTGDAIVAHFKNDVFGDFFFRLPEIKHINHFLSKSDAIQLINKLKKDIAALLRVMEHAAGYQRIALLLHCLELMSTSGSFIRVTHNFASPDNNINPAIEKIIDYSFKHYLDPVSLQQVADIAEMSIPTFCRFFKKNVKKTYFNFLQDLRIGHACKLLANTSKPVMDCCYESGYNSWAHFSKQFKQVKQITPSQYRREFVNKGK
ncbi:MAG: helix-turn-helix domain-containing protein [Bacteroidetes bacterium]|nr:helix-turn-helix domain-containing protein [Bacteroidota bacterium]